MDKRPPKRPHPFSIASLLSLIAPPPPKRRFMIDDLLAPDQSGSGSIIAKDYVTKLDSISEQNTKFKVGHYKSRFSITDLPADPEALLAGIFQHCIDEAIEKGKEKFGAKPSDLGCLITSPLLHTPIYTPIRPVNENNMHTLLNFFLKVAQSKKQDGICLWGQPFEVSVTTVNKAQLPTEQQIIGGSKQNAPVHHSIPDHCLIKINNHDGYCLFYALIATLMHAIAGMTRQRFHDYINNFRRQRGHFYRDVMELMEAIGAPMNLSEYNAKNYVPSIVSYWNNVQYAGRYKFKVFIFEANGRYKPTDQWGPVEYDTPIILYLEDGHFNGVQKPGNLFGKPFCLSCMSCYDRASEHSANCAARCIKCSRIGPKFPCKPLPGFEKHCVPCGKTFYLDDCYQWHLQSSFCKRSKQCDNCHVIYNVSDVNRNGRKGHVCFEKWCNACQDYHDKKRGCFIKPLEVKPCKKPYRFVAFDMETTQHELADGSPAAKQQKRKHVPNFIAAKISCPDCIASGEWKKSLKGNHNCKVCGEHRTITFNQQPFTETTVDKQVVTQHPIDAFVKWILYELPLCADTYAYSHYGGKFDNILVIRKLYTEKLLPEIIRRGNKLYELKVEARKKRNPMVVFRDSYNLMPTSLASLVPTFGLDVIDKPFFPHMANRPENYGRPILLEEDDYLASGMMPATKAKFDEWFSEHRHEPFLLDEALASYCMNDVDILMAGMIAFRAEFLEVSKRPAVTPNGKANRPFYKAPHSGIDVLRDCMTIASACMRHFRANHLDAAKLAIVSDRGYDHADKQSLLATRFLNWYAFEKKRNVRHAATKHGEKKVGKYKLDGWLEDGGNSYGIEVHGCIWHSCPVCYPSDTQIMNNGKMAGVNREQDAKRLKFLREQVGRVDLFWECEIRKMLEADPFDKEFIQACSQKLGFEFVPDRMKKLFADIPEDYGPLDIRKAFMGGRTGPLKMFHAMQKGEKISYYDVTSLYPYINFTTHYPIGHPELIVVNKSFDPPWTESSHNPYPLALIKAFVVPPRKIDVPILPVRVNDRLLFPLCITCARKYPEGAVKENYSCNHNDRARGWITTCTSLELDAALDKGYQVTELYRVLNYARSDDNLFKPYMREFIKQKIEASGFEKAIAGNAEAEQQFIDECRANFGFEIDPKKMARNPGKRAIAKLAVNNLWGRFSLRNELSRSKITNDPSEMCKYLNDNSIEVSSLDELTPETYLISYVKKKEWVEEHPCSNIVISLFTTSAARLLLLKAMQKVAETPGCTLLYTDTDSLIYVHPEDTNPLELGPHLGQFTDEYGEHHIVEYVSGGCKQYGLKLRRKNAPDNSDFEYVLKIRGMTLSHDVVNGQDLRYETFKDRVLKYARTGVNDPMHIVYPNFLRPSIKLGAVFSTSLKKIYRPIVCKGIIDPHTFKVLDFGYCVIKPEQ